MKEEDKRALANIEKNGCHVLHILEEGDLPPFSYSIGIQKKCNAPELIIVGLKRELSHEIINDYNDRVKGGENFEAGKFYSEFIEGFDVKFEKVHPSQYREHFGRAQWLYKGDDFRAFQLIYPNTSGDWPWDEKASDWFRARQPLLNKEK